MIDFVNLEIRHPALCMVEGEYLILNKIEEFTTCKKSYIETAKKQKEFLLDANGGYYKTIDVEFAKYTNVFGGFSLRFAGFGGCRVKKEIIKIKDCSFEDLQKIADSFLNFYKRMNAGTKEEFLNRKQQIDSASTSSELLNIIFHKLG
jgi:hypothetical protein